MATLISDGRARERTEAVAVRADDRMEKAMTTRHWFATAAVAALTIGILTLYFLMRGAHLS